MNKESLKQLEGISDVGQLRSAIEALCLPFGRVLDIRLLPDQRGEAYLCFVELDSPNLNPAMIDKLGGINYGNSVAFTILFKHSRN